MNKYTLNKRKPVRYTREQVDRLNEFFHNEVGYMKGRLMNSIVARWHHPTAMGHEFKLAQFHKNDITERLVKAKKSRRRITQDSIRWHLIRRAANG